MGVTAMDCNGICSICQTPCFRGEIPLSPKEEVGISKAFDSPISLPETENTGLAVIENLGEYEVVKRFGKEKVRKIK